MTVDSHAHASEFWFEPIEVLLFQMDRNGIDRAVLVQHSGEFDNDYILDSAAAHPDRFTAVVCVDVESPTAADDLLRASDAGAVGVRLRPSARSTHSDDPLEVWRAAHELGMSVSALGPAAHFSGDVFREILDGVPGLRVAVEHLGELRRNNDKLDAATARAVYTAIEPYSDVAVKIHGFGEGSGRAEPRVDSPFANPKEELHLLALEILGAERLMWGSDFPPSSGREGYANTLRYPREGLRAAGLSTEGERAVFEGTALRYFGPTTR